MSRGVIRPVSGKIPGILCLVLGAILLPWGVRAAGDELAVRFIDVGQGDSILVKTPGGRAWLVDGGPRSHAVTSAIVSAMEAEGVSALDGVVITHPHLDHFGGLLGLIDEVEVGRVLYNVDVPATTYQRLVTRLEEHSIPYERVSLGSQDWDPDLEVRILAARGQEHFEAAFRLQAGRLAVPEAVYAEQLIDACGRSESLGMDLNSYSVIVHIRRGTFDLLLTGDATEEVEEELTDRIGVPEMDVLKVAHHGSRYSSTLPFLEQTHPEIGIIQVGAGNRYGHPHREAIRRLQGLRTVLYRNDEDGVVRLRVDASGDYSVDGRVLR